MLWIRRFRVVLWLDFVTCVEGKMVRNSQEKEMCVDGDFFKSPIGLKEHVGCCGLVNYVVCLDLPGTLKLTASLHLKMDGWKTIVSFWDGFLAGANC